MANRCETNVDSSAYKTILIPRAQERQNAMLIMKRLLENTKLGLTDLQAAAIVGNIYGESHCNPTAYVASDNGQGQSGGLCQWHDEVNGNGRFTNMINFVKSYKDGKTWADIEGQIQYLFKELDNKYKFTITRLRQISDISLATATFCCQFEVAGECYRKGCNPPKFPANRIGYAKGILQEWRNRNQQIS